MEEVNQRGQSEIEFILILFLFGLLIYSFLSIDIYYKRKNKREIKKFIQNWNQLQKTT